VKGRAIVRGAALAAVFLALALAVTWPALSDVGWWGVHDWVQFYTYYGVPHRAVAKYHELPAWDPYYYGGNLAWGHPDDPTLSPLFVPMLLFGVVAGTKIDIVLVLCGGMLSMWLLARRVGLSAIASVFAAAVWGLNGWHAYHFAVGHCDHFTFLFEPLALYFFLRAVDDRRWAIGAAAVMAFMYLSGGPYPFVFTGILLVVTALLFAARTNSARPLAAVAATLALAAGFAAVKLLATIEFVLFAEGAPADVAGTGWRVLWRALFDPALPMFERYAGTGYGAWEYAAFIGYIPAAAFIAGVAATWRRTWAWIAMGALFLVTSFGAASAVNFFSLFTAPPGLSGMHVAFRFIVHFILAVAIVGGAGLDAAKEFVARRTGALVAAALAGAVVTASAANLAWMHYDRPVPLYRLASFFLPPREYGGRPPEIPYRKLTKDEAKFVPVTYSEALAVYAHFLESKRLPWGYDATHLAKVATFPDEEGYRGEAYFVRGEAGKVTSVQGTLSRYDVKYEAAEPNTLILNQNYFPGWSVSGAAVEAYDRGGLVAADVAAGTGEVEFVFRPRCLWPGAAVTMLTIAAACVSVLRGRRRAAAPPA